MPLSTVCSLTEMASRIPVVFMSYLYKNTFYSKDKQINEACTVERPRKYENHLADLGSEICDMPSQVLHYPISFRGKN